MKTQIEMERWRRRDKVRDIGAEIQRQTDSDRDIEIEIEI